MRNLSPLTKKILFALCIVIILLLGIGYYFIEVNNVKKEYESEITSLKEQLKTVMEKEKTEEEITFSEDKNNIYVVSKNFIDAFYGKSYTENEFEKLGILKATMTEEALKEYAPFEIDNPTEYELPYENTIDDVCIYINYNSYTTTSVEAIIMYTQTINTENVSGSPIEYIWRGTFKKEDGKWLVNRVEDNIALKEMEDAPVESVEGDLPQELIPEEKIQEEVEE